ncbi:MAG: hypothetical protein RJA10_2596 [Pseudomonadota bacterium]|jgi:hypothetical protein
MSRLSLPDSPPPARPLSLFLASLGARSMLVTLALGVLAAVGLAPMFAAPFVMVLGRTLVLAVLLLVVHAAAKQWPPRWLPCWMPPWLWPMAAVLLAALPCTLLIYWLSLGGDVEALVQPRRILGMAWIAGSGMVLGLLAAAAAGVRERLAEARAQALQFALERSRLEKQALDARLALLQAQVEPHFLFNTLANVQALVEAGSPRAPQVLKSLIAYLRAAMPRLNDGAATLAHELALVQSYLELMRMRMPDRLQFDITCSETSLLQRPFPPMAVLTLVENAIRHGIDPLEQGGRIEVHVERDRAARGWQLRVSDDGMGLNPRGQPGTGLANLRERLQGFFGAAAALQLEDRQPRGLTARIVVQDGSEA